MFKGNILYQVQLFHNSISIFQYFYFFYTLFLEIHLSLFNGIYRCILGELWSRHAMFNANAEAQQLELIFSILGCPSATLLTKFRELPDWEKCAFQNFHYTCRLSQSATSQRMDAAAFKLMEALLDLDPETRMTAATALQHEYFTQGSPLRNPAE